MTTCRVLVHRDGTTCGEPAVHLVVNRVCYLPTEIPCCARHAVRYHPARWDTHPYPNVPGDQPNQGA